MNTKQVKVRDIKAPTVRDRDGIRIGKCRDQGVFVLQVRDKASDDAGDQKGWMCLHGDTRRQELRELKNYVTNGNSVHAQATA